jgi:hypothetical protein
MKGIIYIISNGLQNYIGSTTKNKNERLAEHIIQSKQSKNLSSKIIINSGREYDIKILEEIEFNLIDDLKKKEQYYLNLLPNINYRKAYESNEKTRLRKQQWEIKNRDKRIAQKKNKININKINNNNIDNNNINKINNNNIDNNNIDNNNIDNNINNINNNNIKINIDVEIIV